MTPHSSLVRNRLSTAAASLMLAGMLVSMSFINYAIAQTVATQDTNDQLRFSVAGANDTCVIQRMVLERDETSRLSGQEISERFSQRLREAMRTLAQAATLGDLPSECGNRGPKLVYEMRFPIGDIFIDPGLFEAEKEIHDPLAKQRRKPALHLNDSRFQKLNADNRLLISGEGMYRTKITVPIDTIAIRGKNARFVTIRDLHFTQHTGPRRFKVSQGLIVAKGNAVVDGGSYPTIDVQIDEGFPMPKTIDGDRSSCRDPRACHGGKYLRRYSIRNGNPHITPFSTEEHLQWLWSHHIPGPDRTRRIYLSRADAKFSPGQRIAIKSKHGSSNAAFFEDGERISFFQVQWSQESRTVFRNVDQVTIKGSLIKPMNYGDHPKAVLATSAGGPQIGQPQLWNTTAGQTSWGHNVQGNEFKGVGDDTIALFNTDRSPRVSLVQGNKIVNAGARGVYQFDVDGYLQGLAFMSADHANVNVNAPPWNAVRVINNTTINSTHYYGCFHWSVSPEAPRCAR
ncbi:hypothetical protein N9383_05550 [Granulosicoccus sp.]|nr:hypothetical protein [Granulosicoccus sp.]